MITVDINKAALMAQLTAAVSRIKMEVRKATHEAGKHLKAKVQESFDMEGPGWARLADSTIRTKGHSRILYDTGTLRRSQKVTIKSWKSGHVGPGTAGYPRGRTATQVAIWMERPYGTQPARPIYGPVAQREADEVARIYHEAILRALGGL